MGSLLRLPEEVIEDILVRLPAKSIIRFKAVSKSWFDLIKSSCFVRKHQIESDESFLALLFNIPDVVKIYSQDYPHRLLGHFWGGPNSCPKLYILSGLNFELSPSYDLDFKGGRGWHAVGDYNGILCLTNYESIMLVNPSWKESKTIPNPFPYEVDHPRGYCICSLVGFGFDNMTMDFKVVRVLTRYVEAVLRARVEVYNLRLNSWRKLNGFPFPELVNFNHEVELECCTFFNGVIHWCFKRGIILTFNLANNLFNQLEFPQGFDKSRESFRLSVLNQESLAFLSYTRSSYPQSSYTRSSNSPDFVNVWIMNKHSTEATWTKLYSIGPLTQFQKPLSLWKKDKFIYKATDGKVVLYDVLNHSTSVVCDVSQIRLSNARLKARLEFGVYRSSLGSINM